MGWGILAECQGRGLASEAASAVVAELRLQRRIRFAHAFPGVDNQASNAVCRKAGFTCQGECDYEYPRGTIMRCNDWRVELFG